MWVEMWVEIERRHFNPLECGLKCGLKLKGISTHWRALEETQSTKRLSEMRKKLELEALAFQAKSHLQGQPKLSRAESVEKRK